MKVPLCKPFVGIEEKKLVNEVLDSGVYVGGEKTKTFEENFAKYIGTKYALSFNSCASALQAIIQVLNIKGKVVLPSFTHMASANAIVNAGCTPVFVDVEWGTGNINPTSLREALEKDKEIKAVMIVHYAGQSCKMDKIMDIAKYYGIEVIEDSAECIGGTFEGKRAGSFSYGCFSFFPTKNITTGEGGMVTFNNPKLINKLDSIRAHGYGGEKTKPWKRQAVLSGYNFRMGEINAAIGIPQLEKLDEMNKRRKEIAQKYNSFLSQFSQIETPITIKECDNIYQMYVIKVKPEVDRDNFVLELNKKGVGASVHFDPPVHLQPAYIGAERKDSLEITERLSKRAVTLPIFPSMKDEEVEYVCKSIGEILR